MKIIVYTSPNCHYSKKAKDYLHKKKIEYIEKDIIDDAERNHHRYREEMIDKTGTLKVPVIDIDGLIIEGFKPKKIDEALSKKSKITNKNLLKP